MSLMKKLTIVLVIVCMTIPMNGCKISKSKASAQGALRVGSSQIADSSENGLSKAASKDDKIVAIPQDMQEMFRSCAQLVSYLAVSTYDVDIQNLSVEDFWLIMSLVTYAEKPELVGEFGTIDMEYEDVCDIAEAFFSETLAVSDMPTPQDIYSASYVPAEKLYELQPVSIGDINPELVSIEQTDQSGKRFLMRINLVDQKERIKKTHWHVSLESWPDDADHFFPYKFIKAWHVD